MDVAVDPNFARNRLVYFTYSEGDASANRTAVARTRLDANRLSRFQRLFANADSKTRGQHFGSRLLFLPDGSLLVSIGDGGNPPISFAGADIRQQAQNVRTHFGKVLRLNPDGSVPRDNPLRTTEGARPEIWSFGHRNVQGLARDPETGAVWASEHGAAAGDEINRLEAGANYGWPAVTFARNYFDGSLISTETRREGMQDPVVVWLDTHSPSGLAVYRGQEFPQLRGALLSGGLITQDIRVIRPQPAGRARETRIPIGARVRDVAIGPDGRIYILTDGESARLLRIESSGAHSS
jgi:glucose/arabinose dehydrogenase